MREKVFILFLYLSMSFIVNAQSYSSLEYMDLSDNSYVSRIAFDSGYSNSRPCMADFDGDGLIDLVTGNDGNSLILFKNTGTATEFKFTEIQKPLIILDVYYHLSPCAVDLDLDGDMDIVVGSKNGKIIFLENTGVVNGVPQFVATDLLSIVALNTKPAFSDFNGDGLLDLFVGSDSNHIYYYLNTGDAGNSDTSLRYAFDADPSGYIDTGLFTGVCPTFFNGDSDSDDELLCGEKNGKLLFYDKVDDAGDITYSLQTSAFLGVNLGANSFSTPCIVDLDGDGNSDLLLGSQMGNIRFYKGSGGTSFTKKSDNIGYTDFSITYGAGSSVLLVDLDNDGYKDMLVASDNSVRSTGMLVRIYCIRYLRDSIQVGQQTMIPVQMFLC